MNLNSVECNFDSLAEFVVETWSKSCMHPALGRLVTTAPTSP